MNPDPYELELADRVAGTLASSVSLLDLEERDYLLGLLSDAVIGEGKVLVEILSKAAALAFEEIAPEA